MNDPYLQVVMAALIGCAVGLLIFFAAAITWELVT
jgi:hypothetical protein